MGMIGSLARIGRRQARNAHNCLRGRPVQTPSLSSMTLDVDDVELARRLLRNRTGWNDRAVVGEYERQFAAWNGSRHAFAFMGARVALSACIAALDLQTGDEVILPGYTCVVVVNALRYAGVTPVYADIEHETFGLDLADLKSRITSRTRAIIVQHLYGLVSRDAADIIGIARQRGIRVIEDCAHSTGASLHSTKVGNMGDAAVYSSERSKVFSTVAGGLATTNDDRLARRLGRFRDAAPEPDDRLTARILFNAVLDYYRFKDRHRWWRADLLDLLYWGRRYVSTSREEEAGRRPAKYDLRMRAPIARLGLNQLTKVDRYNAQRRQHALRWDRWCDARGYLRPTVIEGSQPVFLRYPVMVEPERKRDRRWAITDLGVEPGLWFASNLHPVPGTVPGCPKADEAVACCINLPCLMD